MIEFRAQKALPIDGKPSWYGQYAVDAGLWVTAASQYGMIRYTTPEAAVQGARVYAAERSAMEHMGKHKRLPDCTKSCVH